MSAPVTGIYADLLPPVLPSLEYRLANALGEAMDLLEEYGVEPANLLDVLGEAETKFASIRRREMEAGRG